MRSTKRLVWSVVVSIAVLGAGCKSFDFLTRAENTFPVARTCSDCHIDIHKEWSQSAHADAFRSPDFQAATRQGDFSECLSCHVPEPKWTQDTPVHRTVFLDDGVTCTTCHLADGKMFGPVEPSGLLRPHPIQVLRPQYSDAAFCGRCHAGTYQQWQSSPQADKPTCQQCHMPAVTRKATQGKDAISDFIVSMEKASSQRRHTFTLDPQSMDAKTFDLNTVIDNKQIAVELHNHLAHSFPTGDFGVQIGILSVQYLDADNRQVKTARVELLQELKTAIPSGQSQKWTWDIPSGASSLKIQLFRQGRSEQDSVELLQRTVPLP